MITTDTHVFFYGGPDIYSNWYSTPSQFTDPLADLAFDNTEAAFMYYKAWFFRDMAVAAKAALTKDPREVKALGRQVRRYDEKSWECVRYGYMVYVNLLKYQQNPEFGAELKATGSRVLVEASPYDKVWGIGRSVDEAAAGAEWQGRNLLGEALMTVRGML